MADDVEAKTIELWSKLAGRPVSVPLNGKIELVGTHVTEDGPRYGWFSWEREEGSDG